MKLIFITLIYNYLKISLVKILLIFILILIFLSSYIIIRNSFFYPLHKMNQKIDVIYLKTNGNTLTMQDLNNYKNISSQILVTTQPNLSFFYKFIYVNKIFKYLDNLFFYEKSNIYLNKPIGGLILYDFNLSQSNKYGGIKNYIEILTKLYSQNLMIIDSIHKKKFLVKIKPLILTDFDYPMVEGRKTKYSRLTSALNIQNNSSFEILKQYHSVNINSFLGPNVDFSEINSTFKSKIDSLILITNKFKLIPCLKHFCYDYSKGNTHNVNSYNDKKFHKLIDEDLLPYIYMSKKVKKSYLIMVGHHKISEIDNFYIASQSYKIKCLIDSMFRNTVTISDEIFMKASSKSNIINPDFKFIDYVKTDIILSHGGNIFDYRREILDKIQNSKILNTKEKSLKILKLKNEYNLIDIKIIN